MKINQEKEAILESSIQRLHANVHQLHNIGSVCLQYFNNYDHCHHIGATLHDKKFLFLLSYNTNSHVKKCIVSKKYLSSQR
jgi:hypothetical protein